MFRPMDRKREQKRKRFAVVVLLVLAIGIVFVATSGDSGSDGAPALSETPEEDGGFDVIGTEGVSSDSGLTGLRAELDAARNRLNQTGPYLIVHRHSDADTEEALIAGNITYDPDTTAYYARSVVAGSSLTESYSPGEVTEGFSRIGSREAVRYTGAAQPIVSPRTLLPPVSSPDEEIRRTTDGGQINIEVDERATLTDGGIQQTDDGRRRVIVMNRLDFIATTNGNRTTNYTVRFYIDPETERLRGWDGEAVVRTTSEDGVIQRRTRQVRFEELDSERVPEPDWIDEARQETG